MEWFAEMWRNILELVSRPEMRSALFCGYVALSYAAMLYANAKSKEKFHWAIIIFAPITIPALIFIIVSTALMARAFLVIQNLYSPSLAILFFALSQFLFVISSTPPTMPFFKSDSGSFVLSFTHGSQYVVVALFVATTLVIRYTKKAGRVIYSIALVLNVCAAVGLFMLLMAQTYVSLLSVLLALASMLVGSIMEDLYSGRPIFTKPAFFKKRNAVWE